MSLVDQSVPLSRAEVKALLNVPHTPTCHTTRAWEIEGAPNRLISTFSTDRNRLPANKVF